MTAVHYIRNGRTIAHASVTGRLLTPFLPFGLLIEPGPSDDFIIQEPPGRCLAGQLTLPHMDGRQLSFVDLHIPSSGQFGQADLRLLWQAGAELSSWRSSRLALAQNDGTFGAPEVAARGPLIRDWRSLAQCAHDAASLLERWPTLLDRRVAWLPVGVPGGTEDIPLTAREAEIRGHVRDRDDDGIIARSARWLGERRPLVSATVAALAQAVIELARASVPAGQLPLLESLLSPLASVAQAATAPSGYRDPDPSSWPVAFVDFAGSCTRAIAELRSSQRGQGVVPLLDTDELYEAWLAITVRDALDARIGPRAEGPSDALAAWEHDDTLFELWVKPNIGRQGLRSGFASFHAIVAEVLTPDLILSASRGDEAELMVLDAKAWAGMLPEDALAQSAKYLYGIRRSSDPNSVPALAGVHLVTCARQPALSETEMAKVHVTTATPTNGVDELWVRLNGVIDQLAAALVDRERLVSTY